VAFANVIKGEVEYFDKLGNHEILAKAILIGSVQEEG